MILEIVLALIIFFIVLPLCLVALGAIGGMLADFLDWLGSRDAGIIFLLVVAIGTMFYIADIYNVRLL